MTGPESENAIVKALKASGVVLRRSLHLDFQRKIDFLIDAYLVPLPSVDGHAAFGPFQRRILDAPFAIQYTKDWDRAAKMREYRDLVFRERAGRERRLYVQVQGSVTPEAAAAHLIRWIDTLQSQTPRDRLEGVEILPEGASMFFIRDRLKKLSAEVERRRAKTRPQQSFPLLERTGFIQEVRYMRIQVRPDKRGMEQEDFITRYQVGSIDIVSEEGGKIVHFQRFQIADRRLLNHIVDTVNPKNDRLKGLMVAYGIDASSDDPLGLMLLVG